MDDFYPLILQTVPPIILTREEVETYFQLRNSHVRATHISATNPRNEDGH